LGFCEHDKELLVLARGQLTREQRLASEDGFQPMRLRSLLSILGRAETCFFMTQ